MALNTVQELVEDIRAGRMVILMDDEDRENEGDLIMAAEHCTPEAINFMIRHARGLVCMPMSRERCEQLELPLMVTRNGSGFGTKFTVSIEAAEGVTTGISAADRARTVQAAAAPDAKAADIVQPGHIFPLMAEPGGVLRRAGHTEACCDLSVLAGLAPMGVICEVLNEDGTMARRPDLEKFAAEHGLKMGTIADLIEYRMLHEKTVERVTDRALDTEHGPLRLVSFRDRVDSCTHVALVKGEIRPEQVTTVRVHILDPLRDLLGAVETGRSAWNMRRVLDELASVDAGVVILLAPEEGERDVQGMIDHYFSDARRAPRTDGPAYRNIGTGSQILRDLGVQRMRLLSSPMRFNALSGFDLEIVEYVSPSA
ncbi:bifunctional 3,4-dihydroxy-2-butanone-4-phosphate synthase/GTP cyclohydrolase II [Isoalcanivorax beigongshangi]|uniref:3,4-dihydroxy-2-butanone 4-phosphate synthase n=1 Tax=Isoalcanivorax beigongshangi TaxID=3238810 RepID=A0ABV4ADX8_9GAMM